LRVEGDRTGQLILDLRVHLHGAGERRTRDLLVVDLAVVDAFTLV
jgi:hypothetical protein